MSSTTSLDVGISGEGSGSALDDRSLGWLRYLHRKATTPDNWDREGQPHQHWDNITGAPLTSWHRFDLVDSSYAVALMSDRTPAWREVYSEILDQLVTRHTSWWAAEDWMTQFGPDPDRANYPEAWRSLIPLNLWGDYAAPGLSLIHICRCRRIERCRSRWSPYH